MSGYTKTAIHAYLTGAGTPETTHDPIQDLVNAQAPMVRRIALHLSDRLDRMVDVDDLIQSGFIGLLEAAHRYDPTTGVPFDAYALTRVRGAMVDELRRSDWCPRTLRQQGKQIRKAKNELEQSLSRPVQTRDVAEHLNMPLEVVQKAETRLEAASSISLDTLVEDRGDSWDVLGSTEETPFSPLLKKADSQELASALQTLPEREQLILHLYYEKEMNLKEIALIIELTEARICQLRKKALATLSQKMSEH
ncbi:FliA/WhiG family RNA polymerase sigma factor [Sansalvadorimonas sp. 2012CJ34-2]|uniref:FliA/WhiG family RNA polymerase sigma factor n=1 Tax=Parendozoicomonas callyspongiae TaxID=2942213 RepID=A0ABT0PFI1_9GAMM|nr:FliA/WhiG family RNA polymerase sigma factor [Sansalvadorimonas sp. 2012CJ34-2]MCL6270083.1 FliA/WhiG family RNA polymerase sigma factor [Sansalvadorimonas sp. 2012CJ34-2]